MNKLSNISSQIPKIQVPTEKDTQTSQKKSDVSFDQTLKKFINDVDEAQKFARLLQQCKGHYSFTLNYMENIISDEVCGFIDDTWEGTVTYTYSYPCVGNCLSTTPHNFSLPGDGGLSTYSSFTYFCSCCCFGYCGSASGNIHGRLYYYDGLWTVSSPRVGSTTINYQKNCPIQGPDLPALEPIPTGN